MRLAVYFMFAHIMAIHCTRTIQCSINVQI